MDPFVRNLMEQQRLITEAEDLREEATRRMAPGVEVVDALSSPRLTPDEEARVRAAGKAIRLARLREAGQRLKLAGRMPRRSDG